MTLRIKAQYWEEHHRPISADELRKRLKVGSKRARGLVIQLRTDAHRVLEEHNPAADPPTPSIDPAGADPNDGDMIDIQPAAPDMIVMIK